MEREGKGEEGEGEGGRIEGRQRGNPQWPGGVRRANWGIGLREKKKGGRGVDG